MIAAQQGKRTEALRMIGKLKEFNKGPKVRPMEFALLYATLNEKEETLRWLEKAREAGSPVLQNANTWHVYDFLRDDPRFKAWLVKAGFEE